MRPWSEKPGLGDESSNPDDFWFVLVHEASTWPTRRRWLWTKRVPAPVTTSASESAPAPEASPLSTSHDEAHDAS